MEAQRALVEAWGSPLLPEGKEDVVQKEIDALDELDPESPAWRKVGEIGGFKYYVPRKSTDLAELQCWAEGVFDFSLTTLVDLLADKSIAKRLDPNIDAVRTLEEIDNHNRVAHVLMKPMYFTAPRDSVSHEHWQTTSDGVMYRISFPVDHPAEPQSQDVSKRVRALARSCARIQPDPLDPNKTYYRINVSIDVRLDMVPKWIQRTFGSQAQKMNAQNFASNLDKLNKIGRAKIRGKPPSPVSHIVLNEGGMLSFEAQAMLAQERIIKKKRHQTQTPHDDDIEPWSDLRPLDIFIAISVASTYCAALFLQQHTYASGELL
ncbi:Steroidogenic acute regulatory protein, mitochondrial [Hondaea fermentalgiana]|uniref:Steroidogenic acute regulatory protein, mitochondrial n=1 Tax=Hondaea fermentalgiana TaxID=2315210 RepID=A0A2R5G6N5_9STRA|nr:Steroidogenic acute regulatory protein, mitochondrial [Hondaea fermentalgiana]|eukprot:GBG25989.1 Steroidogenic acute regulatory protein, mitochondrial [Hondaea fermentalgiana]